MAVPFALAGSALGGFPRRFLRPFFGGPDLDCAPYPIVRIRPSASPFHTRRRVHPSVACPRRHDIHFLPLSLHPTMPSQETQAPDARLTAQRLAPRMRGRVARARPPRLGRPRCGHPRAHSRELSRAGITGAGSSRTGKLKAIHRATPFERADAGDPRALELKRHPGARGFVESGTDLQKVISELDKNSGDGNRDSHPTPQRHLNSRAKNRRNFAVVAPRGIGRETSWFEVSFEGLAFAA
jgi:hypothetical protein